MVDHQAEARERLAAKVVDIVFDMCEHTDDGELWIDRLKTVAKVEAALSLSGEPTDKREKPIRDLVERFSAALLEKLIASEKKYGWHNGWKHPGWREDLIRELHEHVAKGDPRDVAAYCAFAWHHGWKLESRSAPEQTRFNEFADEDHPCNKWWKEFGQFMMSGGGRPEFIWACRGWIAREQLAEGVEVTGDSLREERKAEASSSAPLPKDGELRCTCPEIFDGTDSTCTLSEEEHLALETLSLANIQISPICDGECTYGMTQRICTKHGCIITSLYAESCNECKQKIATLKSQILSQLELVTRESAPKTSSPEGKKA
jgi:hypothetical protein